MTVCKSVVQEEFLLKTFAVEEEHVLTPERVMEREEILERWPGYANFTTVIFRGCD